VATRYLDPTSAGSEYSTGRPLPACNLLYCWLWPLTVAPSLTNAN
jgi:hypothetical protein